MPITFTPAPPGGFVGPGVRVTAVSDLVGPIATDSNWIVSVYSDLELAPTSLVGRTSKPAHDTKSVAMSWLTTEQDQTAITSTNVVGEGAQVGVQVQLNSPTTGDQDTPLSTTAVWTTRQLGGQILLQTEAGAQGGLTTEEHGWLEQVQQFVQNTLTFGGTIATQLGAGGLVDHPDLNLLSLCDQELTLSGTGSITRPRPGVGVEAYGLRLNVAVSPPGAGLLEGIIREFSVRVIQLVTVHKSATQPDVFPVEIFDSKAEAETWLWRAPFPDSISYHVTPGFVVLARWLCLPQF